MSAGRHAPAPIAFFHGYLGQPTLWDGVLAHLASGHPTTLAVLPGHGSSPWTPPDARFEAVIDAFVERIGLATPTWLVGYSMGARIALSIALRHPSLALGAVLIGVDPGIRAAEARRERLAWEEERARAVLRDGVEAFARQWATMPLFATQARLPSATRAQSHRDRTLHTAPGLAWSMRVLGLGNMPDLWDDLARSDLPLRIVTGSVDTKFTSIGREVASRARRARHEVVPEAGHNVALEAPLEVARHLGSALAAPTT